MWKKKSSATVFRLLMVDGRSFITILSIYKAYQQMGGTMAFKTKKIETNDFSTPQEMFQDNKLKTIKGILDYQSQMLDNYLKTISGNTIVNKNVALELPTGSGKTLVGLLIGEFHRRKYKRKCLFLCPTNQLVSQVCQQAREQYGIDAIPFIGKQADYAVRNKSKYMLTEAIGVTTYSSFFATNSFFNDPEVLIFDDVHSSEEYIVDNWTLEISRQKHPVLFSQVAAYLTDVIGDSGISRLNQCDPYTGEIMNWTDMLPRPKLVDKCKGLYDILQAGTKDDNLRFAWERVADHLVDCQIYVSWSSILIRPYISPTETHPVFRQTKQRIFMSATLGSSGELERLTGCRKIKRLPIVGDWDKKGLGRRLFIFPDLSLSPELHNEILIKLHQTANHSVVIVPSDHESDEISEVLARSVLGIKIFKANDLIHSKHDYCEADNSAVIMANRFDGVDFPDDESRMLFLCNLPRVTHLQERFFVGKMAASLLYTERIKTRIVQAAGRCTRNASDYSVVCVLGDSILNEFTSPKVQSQYHPELRAEILFGIENSTGFTSVEDIVENVQLFYARGEDWVEAEAYLVDLRNQYVAEEKDTSQQTIMEKLLDSAQSEVEVQYELWNKNYQTALEKAIQIVEKLNAPSLSGYKCYWQYVCGSLALELGDRQNAKRYFEEAIKNNKGGILWLADLINSISFEGATNCVNSSFYDVVEHLEESIQKIKSKNNVFEDRAKEVLDGLHSDGETFETAHCKLGSMLGFDAHNSQEKSAPDPYWIVNDHLCIVSEDKIYETDTKKIPAEHIRQAAQHATWISKNVNTLRKDATIITLFVSNANSIEEDARLFADNIFYLNRDNLCKWATRAIESLRTVRSSFQIPGDSEWRTKAEKTFEENGVTPDAFIKFATRTPLSNI